jgi:hypothetical protein
MISARDGGASSRSAPAAAPPNLIRKKVVLVDLVRKKVLVVRKKVVAVRKK